MGVLMRQIQNASLRSNFSVAETGKLETVVVNRCIVQTKKWLNRLIEQHRELLVSAAVTLGFGISVLLVSYLFFAQLAAYGW